MPEGPFVSSYAWLLAPGDAIRVDDYSTPTRVKTWLKANEHTITESATDRRQAYGQWIAQLLQVQLGIRLVKLYTEEPEAESTVRNAWPITLSDEAFEAFEDYFEQKALALQQEQEAQQQPPP